MTGGEKVHLWAAVAISLVALGIAIAAFSMALVILTHYYTGVQTCQR